MSFQGFAFFDEKIIRSFFLFFFCFGIRATKCPDLLYGMLISLYQVLIKNVVLETLFFQSAAPLTKFLILYNFFTIYITDVWMRRNKGITEDIFSLLLQFDFNHFLCALTAGLSWKVHHDRNVVGLVTYVGKKSLSNYRLQETERMEWMNEWTNEWMNEWMEEWMNEWKNE